jgi:hypothetical protein
MEMEMNTQHMGSGFDGFLTEENLLEDATAIALKRVIAWQIKEEMELQHITKTNMAKRMNTSCATVDRLLDTTNSHLTLTMLVRSSIALNKTIKVELVG